MGKKSEKFTFVKKPNKNKDLSDNELDSININQHYHEVQLEEKVNKIESSSN